MNRRDFMKLTGKIAVTGYVGVSLGGYAFLRDEINVKPPAEIEGRILLDLHTHPARKLSLDALMNTLSTGITGLARRTGRNDQVLTFEDALNFPGARKIDYGLGELTYKGKKGLQKGYFLRNQESVSFNHILSVGLEGEYLDLRRDSRRVIELTRKQNGLSILAHPYLIDKKQKAFSGWKLVKPGEPEEKTINELAGMVDAVESFNAFCNNLFPGLAWFRKQNDYAKQLVKDNHLNAVIVSDAHDELDQMKVAGIYIPYDEKSISTEQIKHYIRSGNFKPSKEQYVNKLSALQSLVSEKL